MIKNKVKAFREKKRDFNVSKAHLARKIGVQRSYVTKLEDEAFTPSLEKAFKLADYFKCSIHDIFSYVKDERVKS